MITPAIMLSTTAVVVRHCRRCHRSSILNGTLGLNLNDPPTRLFARSDIIPSFARIFYTKQVIPPEDVSSTRERKLPVPPILVVPDEPSARRSRHRNIMWSWLRRIKRVSSCEPQPIRTVLEEREPGEDTSSTLKNRIQKSWKRWLGCSFQQATSAEKRAFYLIIFCIDQHEDRRPCHPHRFRKFSHPEVSHNLVNPLHPEPTVHLPSPSPSNLGRRFRSCQASRPDHLFGRFRKRARCPSTSWILRSPWPCC
jgi:hypothetical protein